MLRRDIYTSADICRSILVLTILATLMSGIGSAVGMSLTLGTDLGATISIGRVWTQSLAFSIALPMAIAPIVTYKHLKTQRDLHRACAELSQLARTDPLTGLLNRRGFEEEGQVLILSARKVAEPVGAVLCDIDYFKRINDTHGHEAGDAVIRHVARILSEVVSALNDSVAGRQGGEEFALLVRGLSLQELIELAETTRRRIETEVLSYMGAPIHFTCSMGLSIDTHDNAALADLLKRADSALYGAKHGGRNRVETARAA